MTSAAKSAAGAQAHKHSMQPLLHISHKSLFGNKRLKQKRAKWKLLEMQNGQQSNSYWRDKTEARQRLLKNLKADVTIDLLSDEEECILPTTTTTESAPAPFQPMIFTPNTVQPLQEPHITLIPVMKAKQPHNNNNKNNNKARQQQSKRKSQKPRRCIERQPLNENDSIVLTDDDDDDSAADAQPSCSNSKKSLNKRNMPAPAIVPHSPTKSIPFAPCIMQVDEEVTVSLVPRSHNGSCAQLESCETQPDETVVHTVIANVPYELTLAKLREGLAACDEPDVGNSKTTAKARKSQQLPTTHSTPTPVALKLSSDLSISLISDDEEEDPLRTAQPQLVAELLRQQQPHLSVQQLPPLLNNKEPKQQQQQQHTTSIKLS